MTPNEKAVQLYRYYIDYTQGHYNCKQCCLIVVDEIIKYHESLYNKGFKDVHIALSSPIKTYNDILNPLLKYWEEVKQEIQKL